MASRIQPAQLGDRGALWNLVLIWVVIVVGLLAAIGCVGYILNESLISYSTCSGRIVDPCTDAGWFSSMGLTFFGSFAAVITGGAFGIRRHFRASGVWYPVAGLGGALLLTAIAVVILKAATNT